MPRALVLHPEDNIATLIDPGSGGEEVSFSGKQSGSQKLGADVPYGHKIALRPIAAGEKILKYGQVIGQATAAIAAGDHVHVHNVEALRARGDV